MIGDGDLCLAFASWLTNQLAGIVGVCGCGHRPSVNGKSKSALVCRGPSRGMVENWLLFSGLLISRFTWYRIEIFDVLRLLLLLIVSLVSRIVCEIAALDNTGLP